MTYYTLDALGVVNPEDITRMSTLRNTPPPQAPLDTITEHLRNKPAPVIQAADGPDGEWDTIVKQTPKILIPGIPGNPGAAAGVRHRPAPKAPGSHKVHALRRPWQSP